MDTFHLFPHLPKELRLKIYEDTFEERMLQLGVDAGVPFPPEMQPLGAVKGPKERFHTRLPSLFSVCKESRDVCESVFVAFGPTFIHPRLDILYISLYAVGRMMPPDLMPAYNEDGSSKYPVGAFSKVAIEFAGLKDIPQAPERWNEQPKKWQLRHGKKELCGRGKWPFTDHAEFFGTFGAPKEILLVGNGGDIKWTGGSSRFRNWRSIALVDTKIDVGDQEKMVYFLKSQLPSSVMDGGVKFKVVDVVKEHVVTFSCPYSWRTWLDMTERYIWI
ncbi:hypothetical protein VTL71DRAFT_3541 [Oculimacula yallundae]|uniref:2EXR domain-containing protein n=1 Tax=Oculimacula yallundae TaxID=86028 RepID=A0ABR4C8L7_9HELO